MTVVVYNCAVSCPACTATATFIHIHTYSNMGCIQIMRTHDSSHTRCVFAVYTQTWPSAVPMEETTSKDWFSSITAMLEDWWTRPLRPSLANGLPALFQPVLVLLFGATEIWIKTATQVLHKVVQHQASIYNLSSSVISSCSSLYLLADLIVGAFGVDKAVLYRYVKAQKSVITNIYTILCVLIPSWSVSSIRARPIVSASASLTVQPTMFNQEEKTCELLTGNETIALSWYGRQLLSLKKWISTYSICP